MDDTLLMILNADEAPIDFRLPSDRGHTWQLLIDTISPAIPPEGGGPAQGGSVHRVEARSFLLLRQQPI